MSNPVYLALDLPRLDAAKALAEKVRGHVGGIKLGLEFFLAHGAPGVRYAFPTPVRATGVGFFLDLERKRGAADRAAALLDDGDILVVAGKGHEQGQIVGDTVHPFDDVAETAQALELVHG